MPDISRSDSTRSDASRPRVSFNRDVHVKRIISPHAASAYSLSADGSVLMPTAVRRERPRTRRDMQREARDVLRAAGRVGCRVTQSTGVVSSSEPDSGSSNENQPQSKNIYMSLDRKKLLKKNKKNNLEYLSLEKSKDKVSKPKLNIEAVKKTQLSPIIESPAPDYFSAKKENNIDKMKRVLREQTPTRPPRLGGSGVVKTPGQEMCHNQNLPFSYTEPPPIIAEQGHESRAASPTSDVIYAQVVVSGSEEPRKTTVHSRVARAADGGVMTTALYGPNPGRQPTPRPDLNTRVRLASKYEKNPATDLHDLSLRRQILLSRSESQARERSNTLKKINEPRIPRKEPRLNNVRYLGNDTAVNDKFASSLRKVPKDVELVAPVNTNSTSRRDKRDVRSEEKASDSLMSKLSRIGKSKSFMEEGSNHRGSRMDRVKGLFRKRSTDSEDDPLAARYSEYRGSDLDSDRDRHHSDLDFSEPDISTRKRLSTPNSSRASQDSMTTLTRIKNNKNKPMNTSWFKSLDRLTKKGKLKNKSDGNQSDRSSNLRFFGDTDQESNAETDLQSLKQRYGLHRTLSRFTDSESERPDSRLTDSTIKGSNKSKYDLDRPDYGLKQMNYRLNNSSHIGSNHSDTSTLKNCNYDYDLNGVKYGANISRSVSSVTNSSRPGSKERLRSRRSTPHITVTDHDQEPLSRRVRSQSNLYRKIYDSSADSATEYDSNTNSAKSTIYLHAATVGDIPGPRNLYRSDGRSRSRDELSSVGRTSPLETSKKTLSRSISVLAPWRPKFRQDATINYDSGNGSDAGRGKPPMGPVKKRSLSREGKLGELRFNTIGRENRRQKDVQR